MFKKLSLSLLLVSSFVICISVQAAPIAIGPTVSGPGDGLNARWVNSPFAPHNVAGALNALASGGLEVNQVVPYIDHADGNYYGQKVAGYLPDPLTPDDNFAVSFTGFINITTADTYTFNAFTDDGFRLNIGGETVGIFDGDRAPGSSTFSVLLSPGLYSFEFIGWEQGGAYVDELTWHNSSTSTFTRVDSDNLFTSSPVSEPSTFALLSLGLMVIIIGFHRLNNQQPKLVG